MNFAVKKKTREFIIEMFEKVTPSHMVFTICFLALIVALVALIKT